MFAFGSARSIHVRLTSVLGETSIRPAQAPTGGMLCAIDAPRGDMQRTHRYASQTPQATLLAPERRLAHAALDGALAGDRAAADALLAVAAPVVRARARRALRRRVRTGGHVLESDVDDLAQEVLAAMLSDDARTLRGWDPERGLSFRSFVGLVAQRRISSLLRRSGFVTSLSEGEREALSESRSPHPSPEASLASRERVQALYRSLAHALSSHALDLFERLYLRDESVDEVASATGLSLPSIYQWRRRLLLAARDALRVVDDARATRRRIGRQNASARSE